MGIISYVDQGLAYQSAAQALIKSIQQMKFVEMYYLGSDLPTLWFINDIL